MWVFGWDFGTEQNSGDVRFTNISLVYKDTPRKCGTSIEGNKSGFFTKKKEREKGTRN